jgi:hypothetical protein
MAIITDDRSYTFLEIRQKKRVSKKVFGEILSVRIFLAHRLLAFLALFCLSACSSTITSPGDIASTDSPEMSDVSPDGVAADPDEVVFSGLWADEFDRVYREAKTTSGRQALADGQVSEAELVELKTAYVQCLESLGFTNISIGQGGAMTLNPPPDILRDPDAVNALVAQCGAASTDWDAIVALQFQIRGNPDHIDLDVIMAQCLVRVGLKPEGYTAEDYRADSNSGVIDTYYNNVKFLACNDDPAHAS